MRFTLKDSAYSIKNIAFWTRRTQNDHYHVTTYVINAPQPKGHVRIHTLFPNTTDVV